MKKITLELTEHQYELLVDVIDDAAECRLDAGEVEDSEELEVIAGQIYAQGNC